MSTSKKEVKQVFINGSGKDIAKTMTKYFAQKIKSKKIKPLRTFKREDLKSKDPQVQIALGIFKAT